MGMAEQTVNQRRVKISTTIDPDLLQRVDAFVAEHPEFNRSRVLDEALRLWEDRQIELAIEAQYDYPLSPQDEQEHADWRRIRRAAAERMLARNDDR